MAVVLMQVCFRAANAWAQQGAPAATTSQEERRQLVADFHTGKTILVEVAHYGYDESGRLEMPRALGWNKV